MYSQDPCENAILDLGNHPFSIFQIIATEFVNTPSYFFRDCSFKVLEKPSKFILGVPVVIIMSA